MLTMLGASLMARVPLLAEPTTTKAPTPNDLAHKVGNFFEAALSLVCGLGCMVLIIIGAIAVILGD